MDQQEAYNILGVSQNASKDEIKKAFRDKSKKLHPDVNKSETAEDDFKKLNSAYQLLTDPPKNNNYQTWGSYANPDLGVNFNDFVNDFFNTGRLRQSKPITKALNISFEESILGCKKELRLDREVPCSKCKGESKGGKACSVCKGSGHKATRHQSFIFTTTCEECAGSGRQITNISCEHCKNTGVEIEKDHVVVVTVPAGIFNSQGISLVGQGNFDPITSQYGELRVRITVNTIEGLSRDGGNVVSELDLTLLEALKGCTKTVKTVKGNKDLKIKPLIKNNDIINIKGYGVPGYGSHMIMVKVHYPDNPEKLIEILEKETK